MDGMADAPEANRHWFRLTPDRLVLGLLAAEGFLLLSGHFRWFAFNQHKGWTVLVNLAVVGLTLLLMFLWFAAALLFRCRFQYSLRSLMLLVLAVAVACSWFATQMQRARKQRDVVQAIKKLGGRSRGIPTGSVCNGAAIRCGCGTCLGTASWEAAFASGSPRMPGSSDSRNSPNWSYWTFMGAESVTADCGASRN